MPKNVIVARKLTKVFNSLIAVNRVSFTVKEGEIFGFLGPNGAGKTTTIKMLTTVLKPTSGNASILGHDITREGSVVRQLIGVVPQEYTADEDLTGHENVLLCADLYGIPRDVAKRRAEELLELVDLARFKNKLVETYSGGMRRRLELACGLVNRPKVLFLDEPTLGLDVQTRTVIWEYIRRLREEQGMTILMTTHYLEEADTLCDRVAIIDHGKILIIGRPGELKKNLGGDIITLSIDNDKDVSLLIKRVKNVREVTKQDGSYRIKAVLGRVTAPRIIDFLRKRGFAVTKLSISEPSLNDVYLEFTGRSLRDTEKSPEDVRRQRIIVRRARA